MRNYLKLIFIVLLTGSVGLFIYSAYALLDGRKMEKEYVNVTQASDKDAYNHRLTLDALNISKYEAVTLSNRYSVNLYLIKTCYSEWANEDVIKYNTFCKEKNIPDSSIRPEVEEIYKKWSEQKKSFDSKRNEINSRIYADASGKGKLDVAIVNQIGMFAGGGVVLSFIILLLVYRIPETVTVAHKKSETK